MFDYEKLRDYMGDLDEEALMSELQGIMDAGGKDAPSAMQALQDGMEIVGKRFEEMEYFVGDLIFAGEVMSEAIELLKPALVEDSSAQRGKMILCTVEGDLHDIGKNIVRFILEASGFEVLDLGIDVPPAKIIETAKENNISIIAMSGVLTLALDSMKATIQALKDEGMRDKVHIIIGGSCVTEEACNNMGADAWAYSPQKTVETCKGWAQ